ncbi:hypothetical protein PIB30_004272 [Stylosanthes scabra]|uniref:Ferredoxin thioredoxin reductase alpha chain domain-containing protein n=1 Tax=Stylosanthes scabra TaxID=79078 RepID=A0ABU6T371_9FABA|nr:hypothetical protein [Stylosanthes scabra]
MNMKMSISSNSSYLTRACSPSSSVSVSPNCTSSWMILPKNPLSLPQSSRALSLPTPTRRPRTGLLRCEVAVQVSSQQDEDEQDSSKLSKVGARVRVKSPLKVYHVPKAPEIDLDGMEGQIKQYVGLWNGKRISANLPYKVEFVTEIEGRGKVKFFAHLREDEFEYV